jgi:folate-binding protein YgfZ
MSDAATLISETTPAPTPLANLLQPAVSTLSAYAGAITPKSFSSLANELTSTLSGAAIFDLGFRTRIRITGSDRLRWLNGMVSNAVSTLVEGQGNYNFVLNAQGRIQGDGYIYPRSDDLIFDTDRAQATHLLAHLNHFIIMDDVELVSLDETSTAIGCIGPAAAQVLSSLGIDTAQLMPLHLFSTKIGEVPVTVVRAFDELRPRFDLWFAPENAGSIWNLLLSANATPAGTDALDALRIWAGTPRYGADITDRHLAQETGQLRALNFNKGCYLGQEIVERIRSRATVHRTIKQFQLSGSAPSLPAAIYTEDDPKTAIGQLTSSAEVDLPEFQGTFAIGTVRIEALERHSRLIYDGGQVVALDHPPVP